MKTRELALTREKNHDNASAYQADGLLHLHKAALEGQGIDGWKLKRNGSDVPFMEKAKRRITTRSLTK